jgi:two-component system, sensor histidine kinase and response regulator
MDQSMSSTEFQEGRNPESRPTGRFFGLRMKFVVLFSLILIMTCSSLSWYFIETRRKAMTDHLEELGTILLTNTVRNEHFRIAGIVLEDRVTLDQFMQSLMAIDHVVYVVITTSDGRILDRQSKRTRTLSNRSPQHSSQPIYPDDRIVESLLQTPLTVPLLSRFVLSAEQTLVPERQLSGWLLPFWIREETLYDFAMPVLRKSSFGATLPKLSVDLEEMSFPPPATSSPVVGLVRIGITDASAKQALMVIVRNVSLLTLLIIVAGILSAHLLTSRITTPLRGLASAARQLAMGDDAPVPLVPSTNDEVGELTQMFNVMTQSLHDRNQAITTNLDTIRRQVRQLTTVHQASTAIASASLFDMDELLDTVLQLFLENLGFSRMVVFLYHPEQNCASIARIVGVSQDISEPARGLAIPIVNDGGITADLILHGKPVLIHDVETVLQRIHPLALDLLNRIGVRSFVAVPLRSHGKILGYLGGDRGSRQCSEEDLNILLTIAGHVAAAIDNAKAYSDLEDLTQHLEERIEQRTEELSCANTQLQEHDRHRSTFLSVVSHELRTPMTAIRSFAENMLDGVTGPLTELQHTYLTRIQHNVARLGRIIVELLDWSRLDTKRVELSVEEVSLGQVAAIVADSLRMVASEKNVSLAVEPIESLPAIRGDRDKLEQILWNLIGNAIKFTPPGGRVSVQFGESQPGVVQTCVSDTGCGIEASHVANIFDEFSRVPSAMPASQGAQLGLCITKTLVTMHHGRIWVESQPEVGSRFYFTLPVSGPQDEPGQTMQ